LFENGTGWDDFGTVFSGYLLPKKNSDVTLQTIFLRVPRQLALRLLFAWYEHCFQKYQVGNVMITPEGGVDDSHFSV
jgi:hypothetical protein